MSTLCSTISRFLPFSSYCAVSQEESMQDKIIVVSGTTIDIIVPERSLLVGALQIIGKANQTVDPSEVYQETQKIIRVWQKQGITDFLRYRKVPVSNCSEYNMQIVPFSKSSWGFWQQLKVLWRVTFGGVYVSQSDRQSIAKNFTPGCLEMPELFQSEKTPKDPFCTPDIIEKQEVSDGTLVRVLCDYAPLAGTHLLIVPKRHAQGFSDLTEEEYIEIENQTNRLIQECRKTTGFTAYLFDKTGRLAGQTVPHWHQHTIFVTTEFQGFLGKLKVLKNMLIGSFPLGSDQLKTRVAALNKKFDNLGKMD